MPPTRFSSLLLVVFAVSAVHGAPDPEVTNPPPDKSGYHLFNPTPVQFMRELNTDRPDLTESPYTLDAGHFQVELDLVNFTYDRHNAEHARTESWSFADTNFKVGLLDNVDLQLVVPAYNRVRTDEGGVVTRNSGFGDLTVRVKINLWGNEGGKTAFGLLPFIKIPTNQDDLGNHAVEGGLILPLALELPAGWNMGTMAEFDFIEDGEGHGYHLESVESATFSHKIVGELEGYFESASILSAEAHAAWIATVDVGLTYGITKNVQVDAGVNIGVTRAADDLQPFVGLSWRF